MIFDYPVRQQQHRRHCPSGYASYESYRPWLRDEFTFRCVYCLKRETWGQVTGEFELDHFTPQSVSPLERLIYSNLVYACRRCNSVKSDQPIGDPTARLTSALVSVSSDGSLQATDREMQRLIRQLDLNSPQMIAWRRRWMEIVELAETHAPELYGQLAGFPVDLPDLSSLRPPTNDRIEGLNESWFARRERGELPAVY